MIVNCGVRYLTIGEVSKRIGRTPSTIKNWYEWYELQDSAEKAKAPLPEIFNYLDLKGTRFFRESQLGMFEVFKEGRTYGKMASVSRTKWGKYAQR